MDARRCLRVLEVADLNYIGKEQFTNIETTPKNILHTQTTALWARCDEDEKKVDLQDAPLRAWLTELAANGPGYADVYEGVTYCFVCNIFPRWPQECGPLTGHRKSPRPDREVEVEADADSTTNSEPDCLEGHEDQEECQ
jgi:hypothetical protein